MSAESPQNNEIDPSIRRKDLHYAAVLYGGKVYKGFDHSLANKQCAAENPSVDLDDEILNGTAIHGYATEDGRFVDGLTAETKFAIASSDDL